VIDFGSVWRGIHAMKIGHGKVNYGKWDLKKGCRGFWVKAWTPAWHEGRGPYVSIGLWFFAVGRGY
jgi:hypothetical protein